MDQEEQRNLSVEEVPLIQADLTYGDILRDGAMAQSPRPSLLAITMLPSSTRGEIDDQAALASHSTSSIDSPTTHGAAYIRHAYSCFDFGVSWPARKSSPPFERNKEYTQGTR